MPIDKNAVEVRQEHIDKLGPDLGRIYNLLWNEISWLHVKWQEYRELYGTSPKRIDMLNSAAPLFFRIVQDTLWEDIILSLTRLTDPTELHKKRNLTINALPELIMDDSFRDNLSGLVLEASVKAAFARDWRNRHIAHRDMKIAFGDGLPLSFANRQKVGEAINALDEVMNAISEKLLNSTIGFDVIQPTEGAVTLLYIIRDGLNTEMNRREKMMSGKFSYDDFVPEEPI